MYIQVCISLSFFLFFYIYTFWLSMVLVALEYFMRSPMDCVWIYCPRRLFSLSLSLLFVTPHTIYLIIQCLPLSKWVCTAKWQHFNYWLFFTAKSAQKKEEEELAQQICTWGRNSAFWSFGGFFFIFFFWQIALARASAVNRIRKLLPTFFYRTRVAIKENFGGWVGI